MFHVHDHDRAHLHDRHRGHHARREHHHALLHAHHDRLHVHRRRHHHDCRNADQYHAGDSPGALHYDLEYHRRHYAHCKRYQNSFRLLPS